MNEDELLAIIFFLLVAGHETTVNLIGSGTLELLQHSDQMERLRRDPTLIKSAVEELLRYAAPVFMSTERYVCTDLTIHGVRILHGERALGVIGSANRDETVFDNPDALDIERGPNKHLSFGHGIHYCLGAALARLEAQIAINALLERRKVKCPVLAFNGENDLQVPADENLREIEAALKAGGNADVTIVRLPKLNHLFQTSETGSLGEYAKIEETIAPVALKTIGDWILKRTMTQR